MAWWGDREVALERRGRNESYWPWVVVSYDFSGSRLAQIGAGKTAKEAWRDASSNARFRAWRLTNPEKLDALCLYWQGEIDRDGLAFLMRDLG